MIRAGARRVYVIDDDRDILESTAFLLDTLGYGCTAFAGAAEFLERAPGLPRGCILTDLRMPDIDGFRLAFTVAELGLGWPILMMTSENGSDLEGRAAAAGISALLRKPVEADLLAETLASTFERMQA